MPIIKPISDLRNKSNEISELAWKTGEPIFITKNGIGDLTILSMAQYDKLQAKLELLSKVAEAQQQYAAGDKGKPYQGVIQKLRGKVKNGATV